MGTANIEFIKKYQDIQTLLSNLLVALEPVCIISSMRNSETCFDFIITEEYRV